MATPNSHNEWCTPPELFRVLDDEFRFDCDAAATDENTLCEYWITQEQNALIVPWDYPTVFCNPPYSMLGEFIRRGYEQHLECKNTVVMLIPAYTDPKYWSEYVMKAHEVRFLKGRLQFLENGKTKTSARFPSVIVVFKYIKGEHFGKAPNQWVWNWRL